MNAGADSSPVSIDAPLSGPGARLAAARAARAISIEQMSSVLGFSKRQIQSLEADDYAALPSAVVVRGMVRAYARRFDLEAAPLLAMLPQPADAVVPQLAGEFMDVSFSSRGGPRHSMVWWSIGVLVIALVVYLLADSVLPAYLLQSPHLDAVPVAEEATEPVPPEATAADAERWAPGSPQIEGAAARNNPASGPSSAVPESAPATAQAAQSALPALARPVVPTIGAPVPTPALTPAPTPLAAQVPAATRDNPGTNSRAPAVGLAAPELAFRFVKFAWVEVRDAKGMVILTGAFGAGTEKAVSGTAPLRLVIGSASGVEVRYRGQTVDLASHAVGEVARLTLD